MKYNNLFYCVFLCCILLNSIQLFSQQIRVIDNKGTRNTVNNNNVTTSDTPTTTPVENDVWFDTSDTPTIVKIYDGTSWKEVTEEYSESKTVILNRFVNGNNNLLVNSNNSYFNFPLNDTHIQTINNDYFEVPTTTYGNGSILIKQDGNYLLSAELSTSNMPSGNTKYIIAVFANGTSNPGNIIGYLTRGSVRLSGTDWWGGTGTLMYRLSAGDEIIFRYVINANGNPLNARFLNIGVTKL